MGIFKSTPVTKIINGLTVKTSSSVLLTNDKYTTNGEDSIIVKEVDYCVINLDSKTTEKITIKSLTNVIIVSDFIIDDEFNEIELNSGASIELRFIKDGWYIMSSDGLKNS